MIVKVGIEVRMEVRSERLLWLSLAPHAAAPMLSPALKLRGPMPPNSTSGAVASTKS